jgi:hypothetical protein
MTCIPVRRSEDISGVQEQGKGHLRTWRKEVFHLQLSKEASEETTHADSLILNV